MKNNAKIILTMLCIGLSVNLMGMQKPFRQDILNAIARYVPIYDSTSKEGIAATMAQAWAQRLSDPERIALIYECYTLPANQGANNDWPTRNATNLISAYTEMTKNFAADWWKWISYEKPAQIISGVTGAIGSYVTPAFKYAASFVRTPLKRLDNYLSTNKNAYINGKNNGQWFNDVIRLALEDFNDPDVTQYLTDKQKTQIGTQIDLIVDKILPVMTDSASNNKITPLTRNEVTKWVSEQWLQQPAALTPLQQLAIQKDIKWQEEQKRRAQQQLLQPQTGGWFSGWGWGQQQQQPQQQQFVPQQQQPQQQQTGQLFDLNTYLT